MKKAYPDHRKKRTQVDAEEDTREPGWRRRPTGPRLTSAVPSWHRARACRQVRIAKYGTSSDNSAQFPPLRQPSWATRASTWVAFCALILNARAASTWVRLGPAGIQTDGINLGRPLGRPRTSGDSDRRVRRGPSVCRPRNKTRASCIR